MKYIHLLLMLLLFEGYDAQTSQMIVTLSTSTLPLPAKKDNAGLVREADSVFVNIHAILGANTENLKQVIIQIGDTINSGNNVNKIVNVYKKGGKVFMSVPGNSDREIYQ